MPEPGFLRAVEVLTDALLTPQEFARHKPSPDQMTLRWVTIHPHGDGEEGRRIQINTETGEIEKGFGAGKTMHEAFAPKSESPAATEPQESESGVKSAADRWKDINGGEQKKPWQIPKNEFIENSAKLVSGATAPRTRKLAESMHAVSVRDAVNAGEHVPEGVLADYPSLAVSKDSPQDARNKQHQTDNLKGILEAQDKIKSLTNQAEMRFADGDHVGGSRLMEQATEVERGLDSRKTAALMHDNGTFPEYTSHGVNSLGGSKPHGSVAPVPPEIAAKYPSLADAPEKSGQVSPSPAISELAAQSKSADEFINKIQQGGMLDDVYAWEKSTPENIKKYKNTGWFGIASDMWKQAHATKPPESADGIVSDDTLFKRTGQQFEEIQKSLGIKNPKMGKPGADAVRKALASRPGGPVIAELLRLHEDHPDLFQRHGFTSPTEAALSAIDGKFTKDQLIDASRWAASHESGDISRFMRDHIRAASGTDGRPDSTEHSAASAAGGVDRLSKSHGKEQAKSLRSEADGLMASSKKPFKPEGIPGEQMGLFDQDAGGQKSLFKVVKPDKKSKKTPAAAPSELEKIGDEHKSRSEESAPLPGQKSIPAADAAAAADEYERSLAGSQYHRYRVAAANAGVAAGYSFEKMLKDLKGNGVHEFDAKRIINDAFYNAGKPVVRDAIEDQYPSLKGFAEGRSDEWKPENHVKIAADDISKLRKQDVYRLMENATGARRAKMADYIRYNRPELAGEVQDSLDDLGGDSTASEPAKATESKPNGHAIDPLDIGKHNIAEVLENQKADILKSDPKLSPNAAASLAGARVFNALNGRAEEFRRGIDDRVRKGEEISDDEDAKYIAAGDARRNLHSDIVQHTGYRPMGEVDGHPEANKPLVGKANEQEQPTAPQSNPQDELKRHNEEFAAFQERSIPVFQQEMAMRKELRALFDEPPSKERDKQTRSLQKKLDKVVATAEEYRKKGDELRERGDSLVAQVRGQQFSRKAPHEELIHHLHEAMNHDGKCCYEKEEGEDDIADHVPADHRHMDKSVHELCRHLGASHPELQAAYENYTAAME